MLVSILESTIRVVLCRLAKIGYLMTVMYSIVAHAAIHALYQRYRSITINVDQRKLAHFLIMMDRYVYMMMVRGRNILHPFSKTPFFINEYTISVLL